MLDHFYITVHKSEFDMLKDQLAHQEHFVQYAKTEVGDNCLEGLYLFDQQGVYFEILPIDNSSARIGLAYSQRGKEEDNFLANIFLTYPHHNFDQEKVLKDDNNPWYNYMAPNICNSNLHFSYMEYLGEEKAIRQTYASRYPDSPIKSFLGLNATLKKSCWAEDTEELLSIHPQSSECFKMLPDFKFCLAPSHAENESFVLHIEESEKINFESLSFKIHSVNAL